MMKNSDQSVNIRAGSTYLEGILNIPEGARGIVVFVHGSGSSRFSPRNHYVAKLLNEAGLATLLFDLLTEEENKVDVITRELRFDIDLLNERSIATIDWIKEQPHLKHLAIGLFGASTGAAAALNTAQARPDQIECIVSRGGRPDLAMDKLPEVVTPTLLIVGSLDTEVIRLNQHAREAMQNQCDLVIISGATHLFEEPGTLEAAANSAKNWFCEHLRIE